jgi:hypothetical protein
LNIALPGCRLLLLDSGAGRDSAVFVWLTSEDALSAEEFVELLVEVFEVAFVELFEASFSNDLQPSKRARTKISVSTVSDLSRMRSISI